MGAADEGAAAKGEGKATSFSKPLWKTLWNSGTRLHQAA
jgi:hypothetical protein